MANICGNSGWNVRFLKNTKLQDYLWFQFKMAELVDYRRDFQNLTIITDIIFLLDTEAVYAKELVLHVICVQFIAVCLLTIASSHPHPTQCYSYKKSDNPVISLNVASIFVGEGGWSKSDTTYLVNSSYLDIFGEKYSNKNIVASFSGETCIHSPMKAKVLLLVNCTVLILLGGNLSWV